MRFIVDNVYTNVTNYSDREAKWLGKYLSFEDITNPGAKLSLFNKAKHTFPSGLLTMAIKGVERAGMDVEIMDKRVPPCKFDEQADLEWLRWYQKEATHTAAKVGRGIVSAPTGSGKTEIIVGLVQALKCKWLFLVHRKTLVKQCAERYELRTGEAAFIYTKGCKLPPSDQRFIVTTFQTLYSGLKRGDQTAISILLNAQGLVIDECHTVPSSSFYRVAISAKNAYYRIGMSGTPLARGDQKSLMAIAALGPIVYKIKVQTLIKEGMLSCPTVRMVNFYEECDAKAWASIYSTAIVKSKKRNELVTKMVMKSDWPCLVFVKEIEQGRTLKKLLEAAGLAVDFVWGAKLEVQREAAITRLEYGETEVCISSVVFQEGVDIPILRSIILAGGGKSEIATLQNIGRGMRTDKGRKMTFQVWDVFDNGNRTLARHARKRRHTYMRQGYEVSTIDIG